MQIQTAAIKQGLSNPVTDSQGIFRLLLTAMSEPGSKHHIQPISSKPDFMHEASYAIALALLDQTTQVGLSSKLQTPQVLSSVMFHNSVEWIDDLTLADFIFCSEADECPDLSDLKIGSEAYPDQSCTMVIQCESFSEGPIYTLTGPGIQHQRNIQCSALTASIVESREIVTALFPLGIDIIFTCMDEFFCLPRTTIIKSGSAQCM